MTHFVVLSGWPCSSLQSHSVARVCETETVNHRHQKQCSQEKRRVLIRTLTSLKQNFWYKCMPRICHHGRYIATQVRNGMQKRYREYDWQTVRFHHLCNTYTVAVLTCIRQYIGFEVIYCSFFFFATFAKTFLPAYKMDKSMWAPEYWVWLGVLIPVKTNINPKAYNDILENCVLLKGPFFPA